MILLDFGISLLDAVSHPDLCALHDVLLAAAPEFPELSRALWKIGPRRMVLMLSNCLTHHAESKGREPEGAAEAFCSMCWGLAMIAEFMKGYTVPETDRQRKVSEAVRVFLLAYS